jgi:hypothetical protein
MSLPPISVDGRLTQDPERSGPRPRRPFCPGNRVRLETVVLLSFYKFWVAPLGQITAAPFLFKKISQPGGTPANAVTRKDVRSQAQLQEFVLDLRMRGRLIDPPATLDLGDIGPIV